MPVPADPLSAVVPLAAPALLVVPLVALPLVPIEGPLCAIVASVPSAAVLRADAPASTGLVAVPTAPRRPSSVRRTAC
jgi:hypothetical protein